MAEQGNTHVPERRKFARLRREFVAKIMEGGRYDPSAAAQTGKNISLGGIGIETHRYYPVGTALVLELLLPKSEEDDSPESSHKGSVFYVQCQVIWSSHLEEGTFATGLRFLDLDEGQLKVLSQLIAEGSQ
jgi:c-di-GMP-binding flagellar brake protein YcgR